MRDSGLNFQEPAPNTRAAAEWAERTKQVQGATPNILVVEDDNSTRAQLAHLLRKAGYQVEPAADGDHGWQLFRTGAYPIVLTDWSMPGLSGPDLCRRIRGEEGEAYTYVILITGKSEKANIASGLEAGADDYVTKPFDSGELLARVRTGRRILDLQASMREAQRQLQELASRDGLTGVLNRRALEERLVEATKYVQRRGTALSVAMLDLDHFKQINDTYGHQVGDEVLCEAARRVEAHVREYDAVGRYGGEEFVVVLPDTPGAEALQVSERIRAAVAEEPIRCGDGAVVYVTMSIGVATASIPFDGHAKMLVEAADAALYRAKRQGRNRVESGWDGPAKLSKVSTSSDR